MSTARDGTTAPAGWRVATRGWHRPLLVVAVAMAALAVVCLVGLFVDPRVLTGLPVWDKPFKFSVSIAVYAATLAWMHALVTGERARRWSRRLGTVVAAALAIEQVVIVTQVVRGRTSHFDVATDLDAALFDAMGVTIVVLFLAALGLGVVALRQRDLPVDLAAAVRGGMAISLLGMAVAFLMVVPTPAQLATAHVAPMTVRGAHTVGPPDGGPGLPFLGWSTVGGDLRIGHFAGLHALQGLPLILLALTALGIAPAVRARLVLVAGVAWAGLTLLLTWQALRGQPLVHPDRTTLLALLALVVTTAVAAVLVVRTPRPPLVTAPGGAR